jgi:hypothetical protein
MSLRNTAQAILENILHSNLIHPKDYALFENILTQYGKENSDKGLLKKFLIQTSGISHETRRLLEVADQHGLESKETKTAFLDRPLDSLDVLRLVHELHGRSHSRHFYRMADLLPLLQFKNRESFQTLYSLWHESSVENPWTFGAFGWSTQGEDSALYRETDQAMELARRHWENVFRKPVSKSPSLYDCDYLAKLLAP